MAPPSGRFVQSIVNGSTLIATVMTGGHRLISEVTVGTDRTGWVVET